MLDFQSRMLLIQLIKLVMDFCQLPPQFLDPLVSVHLDFVDGHLVFLDLTKLFKQHLILFLCLLALLEVLIFELSVLLERQLKMFLLTVGVGHRHLSGIKPKLE
jgi:hypothetical protein